jgi:hypothetical protein
MRTAQTKTVDGASTAFAASTARLPARQPGSLSTASIDGEPPRPRHAFPTEAVE